jgi:hypothetical protein
MGFFKKIGSFVKKGAKQISFKNLVKVGSSFDPTGIVGSLQSNHEAKKQAQNDARLQSDFEMQTLTRSNPNLGDILLGAGGGALSGAGQVLAGSTSAGSAGATLVDSTMSVWFQRNWLKLLGGVLGTVTVVVLFLKVLKPQNSIRKNYRKY